LQGRHIIETSARKGMKRAATKKSVKGTHRGKPKGTQESDIHPTIRGGTYRTDSSRMTNRLRVVKKKGGGGNGVSLEPGRGVLPGGKNG